MSALGIYTELVFPQQGNPGLSAYQTWLALGNTGTEQDFIDSLQGAGYTAGTGISIVGDVITNTAPDQTVTISGATGTYPNFTVTPADGSETKINVGTGLSKSGSGTTGSPYVLTNTGVTSVNGNTGAITGILTDASAAGGDLSGVFGNLQLGAGVVGATELAALSVTSAKIANAAVGATQLANTAVAAGSYGSGSLVPVITVDAQGRLTGVTTAAVSGGGGTVTGATNGATLNGANIEFGQTVGAVGDPAGLTASREIPLAGNAITFKTTGIAKTAFDGKSINITTSESTFISPISETIFAIQPPNTHVHVNSPWALGVTDGVNNGPTYLYPDRVWWWGVNSAGASLAANATGMLWQDIVESSWVSGDVPFYERHNVFKMPGKDAIRLTSYTIQHPNAYYASTAFGFDFYRHVNTLSLRGVKNNVGATYTHDTYFAIGYDPTSGGTNTTLALNPTNSITVQGSSGSGADVLYLDAVVTGSSKNFHFRNWNQITMDTAETSPVIASIKINNTQSAGYAYMLEMLSPSLGNDKEAFMYLGKSTTAGDSGFFSFIKNATSSLNRFYFGINGNYFHMVANGFIGAGTSTPTAKLDLSGATGYNQLRMRTSYTPTGSADANGNVGDLSWDTGFIYVKTAAGAWKRAALSTF